MGMPTAKHLEITREVGRITVWSGLYENVEKFLSLCELQRSICC